MTQDERREYLIQYLLKEEIRFGRQNIPTDKQGHEEETGKAKITSGYNLPAKYILHTVGPIIQWKVTKEEEALKIYNGLL